MLFLAQILFAFTAWSLPLQVVPVGKFDGSRILIPCEGLSDDGYCYLDTAGGTAIFRELPAGAAYLREPENIGGIGWQTHCRLAEVPSLRVAGALVPHFQFLHCPEFTNEFSPMVGSDLLWGHHFAVDFRTNDFRWVEGDLAEANLPVWAGGSSSHWIIMSVDFEGQSFSAAWDTGAPVTLVSPAIVAAHPEAFVEELSIEVPPNTKRAGGRAYRLQRPFRVGGVELRGGFVHAVDLEKIFPGAGVPLILGTNHLRQADWDFDLGLGEARVSAHE